MCIKTCNFVKPLHALISQEVDVFQSCLSLTQIQTLMTRMSTLYKYWAIIYVRYYLVKGPKSMVISNNVVGGAIHFQLATLNVKSTFMNR